VAGCTGGASKWVVRINYLLDDVIRNVEIFFTRVHGQKLSSVSNQRFELGRIDSFGLAGFWFDSTGGVATSDNECR
jgi:hypothetical protein